MLATNSGQHKIQQKKKKKKEEFQKDVLTKEKRTEIFGPVVDYKLELSPDCSEHPPGGRGQKMPKVGTCLGWSCLGPPQAGPW